MNIASRTSTGYASENSSTKAVSRSKTRIDDTLAAIATPFTAATYPVASVRGVAGPAAIGAVTRWTLLRLKMGRVRGGTRAATTKPIAASTSVRMRASTGDSPAIGSVASRGSRLKCRPMVGSTNRIGQAPGLAHHQSRSAK